MKILNEDKKCSETKNPSKKDIPMARVGVGMSFKVKLDGLKPFLSQNIKNCKL